MKREKLTPIELECNMGPDVNGVVQREPWKAYDIDEVNQVLDEKDAEIRSMKRALWIARAKRAIEKIAWFRLWNASISTMNPEDGARQEFDKWKKALGKLLAMAEKFK